MDVELTPDSYIIGKTKPQPPLDVPAIHWATFIESENVVQAYVTDYYAMEEAWLRTTAWDRELQYDDNLGYFISDELPDGYTPDPSDYIEATNVVGKSSTHGPIGTIPLSWSEIGNSSVEIIESQTHLTFNVSAEITTYFFDIAAVYLIDDEGYDICQLSGPPEGGTYSFTQAPASCTLKATERIRVITANGHQTTAPVESFVFPNEYYYESQDVIFGIDDSWWKYFDIDTGTSSDVHALHTDVLIHKFLGGEGGHIYPEYEIVSKIDNDVIYGVIYCVYEGDPYQPSREAIADMHAQGKLNRDEPGVFLVDPPRDMAEGKIIVGDSVVFITTEGRYAYVKTWATSSEPCGYKLKGAAYSLWPGPYADE
jgi:hypothetical protein